MIISASYKTDIPTFYGEWFMNRLRAGYCKMVNPFNHKTVRVSLLRAEVDGFVFWTKNLGPFYKHLHEIKQRGFPFIIQYTINAYPKALEFSVVDSSKSVDYFKRAAEEYGSRVCVWRYDPIVIASVSSKEYHLDSFERLARQLRGSTDEVVISFAHLYKKTLKNMNWAAKEFAFSWHDPSLDEKRELAGELAQISKANGIQLSICAQRDYLVQGAVDARCVDARRLEDTSGKRITAIQKGNRDECSCFASRDIGEYDTCPHGCVYCYAVINRELAQKRYREHDPSSDFLFKPQQILEPDFQEDRQISLLPNPSL